MQDAVSNNSNRSERCRKEAGGHGVREHPQIIRAFHALSRGLLGPVSLSILETTKQGLTPPGSKQARQDLNLGLPRSRVRLSNS